MKESLEFLFGFPFAREDDFRSDDSMWDSHNPDHSQNISKQRWKRGIVELPFYDLLGDEIHHITKNISLESPAHTTNDQTLAKAITSMKQKFTEEERKVLAMVPEHCTLNLTASPGSDSSSTLPSVRG